MRIILSIALLFFCSTALWASEPIITVPQQTDQSDLQLEQSNGPPLDQTLGGSFKQLVSAVLALGKSKLNLSSSQDAQSSVSNQHIHLHVPLSTATSDQQETNSVPLAQITNNNYISNNNNNTQNANQNQETHANATVQASFKNFLQQSQINPRELSHSGSAFLRTHKKRVVLGTIATTYGGISLYLAKGYYFLTHQAVWASWKKHMKTEELYTIPQPELQKTLRQEILNRYLTNSKDRLTSYMLFMKAIEQEEKKITRYVRLSQLVKKSRLIRIFPVNDKKIRLARKKRKRLGLVKQLFISWAAEQNFEKV